MNVMAQRYSGSIKKALGNKIRKADLASNEV